LIENPFDETEKGKGILAAELLSRNKTDVIFVQKGFGSKGPSYVFSSENIEVVVTDASTPQQALASLGLSLDTGKGKA
jgi:predicted Fe-Mo cluster-binding NifX family protein